MELKQTGDRIFFYQKFNGKIINKMDGHIYKKFKNAPWLVRGVDNKLYSVKPENIILNK